MRVKIEVTQDDIEKGRRRGSQTCPVARAIKRRLKAGIKAAVYGRAGFVKGWLRHMSDMPGKTQRFVADFDSKRPVKPFTFTLNIPKEYLR